MRLNNFTNNQHWKNKNHTPQPLKEFGKGHNLYQLIV